MQSRTFEEVFWKIIEQLAFRLFDWVLDWLDGRALLRDGLPICVCYVLLDDRGVADAIVIL